MRFQATLQKMCWKWVCCDRLFLFPCIWISTFQTPAQNLQLFTNIKQYLFFMHRLSVSANIFWCHSDCQNQMDVITWSSKFLRDLLLIILVNQPSMASQKKIRHRKSKIFQFLRLLSLPWKIMSGVSDSYHQAVKIWKGFSLPFQTLPSKLYALWNLLQKLQIFSLKHW